MYEQADDLRLSEETQAVLIAAARDSAPVRGLTHGYYKYPARFSPVFASAAIGAFTQPGDLVLDPHVGGGTTLVEAIASGREAIGVDISSLAEFITKVKCTVYSEAELDTLERWGHRLASAVDIRRPSTPLSNYEQLGYYKQTGGSSLRARRFRCLNSESTPLPPPFLLEVFLRKRRKALAGDAVQIAPVSGPNSLQTGNFAGNVADLAALEISPFVKRCRSQHA